MTRIDRSASFLQPMVLTRVVGVLTVVVGLVACSVDAPTSNRPRVPGLSFAKAPTGITVTSADPDSAAQGDVQKAIHVHGSGFAQGAKATWSIAGDTTQVVTNSTTFVSSTELIAVVTVSPTAPISSYDITVTNLGGKKGVGAELFAVKAGIIPLAMTVDDTGPLGPYRITSDGLGEYVNGVQGVIAEIDGSGNLLISMGVPRTSTTPPERTVGLDFSAPVDPLNTFRPDFPEMNFKILSNGAGNGDPPIPDLGINGNRSSGCYVSRMNYTSQTTNYRMTFNAAVDPTAEYVYITRTSIAPGVWTVVSNGPCNGVANQAVISSVDLTGKKAGPDVRRGIWNFRFSIRLRQL